MQSDHASIFSSLLCYVLYKKYASTALIKNKGVRSIKTGEQEIREIQHSV